MPVNFEKNTKSAAVAIELMHFIINGFGIKNQSPLIGGIDSL